MPVTVSVVAPSVALAAVAIVSEALPPDVTDVVSKVAVAPDGTPLTLSVTVSAEPEIVAVEIVLVPDAPWMTVTDVGEALIEKSLGGGGGGSLRTDSVPSAAFVT